jgi:hypothetical protein
VSGIINTLLPLLSLVKEPKVCASYRLPSFAERLASRTLHYVTVIW